jgi:alpha-1,3-glucosyltransferase
MPAYRSTDFDVHRNWLAITHHLPLSEWYFYDKGTVHTLDYPPAFAFFEYAISSNPVTHWLLQERMLDERCLALLPDSDNTPSPACVAFQRSTVILSDVVLYAGAWVVSRAFHYRRKDMANATFMFIILNPGLLWLDHVHFQYNGMLLGILLLSVGLLISANNSSHLSPKSFHFCHIAAAVLFALLLALKHLYLPLAPLYAFYLFRRYCIDERGSFRFLRFMTLAVVTASTILIFFLPFLLTPEPFAAVEQMLRRLFPFSRGLVHDYWAPNVWALYMLLDKAIQFLHRKQGRITRIVTAFLPSLPDVSPRTTALLLLLALIPGMWQSWKAASQRDNTKLLHVIIYSSLTSFMLAYHVHEKAIMTTLLPLTLLCFTETRLFVRTTTFGLLGLFPLLFRPVELLLKEVSYFGYFTILPTEKQGTTTYVELRRWAVVAGIIYVLEVMPIQGKLEFLPLLLTSVVCAIYLVLSWIESLVLMCR